MRDAQGLGGQGRGPQRALAGSELTAAYRLCQHLGWQKLDARGKILGIFISHLPLRSQWAEWALHLRENSSSRDDRGWRLGMHLGLNLSL